MNIAVSVNTQFIKPLKVTLASLLEQHTGVDIYFLNLSLTQDEIADLELFISTQGGAGTLHIVDIPEPMRELLQEAIANTDSTIETWIRVLLPYILPESMDRILWLDADLLIQKPIDRFYNQPLAEHEIAAGVGDDLSIVWLYAPRQEEGDVRDSMPDDYFNAGVLLFDLAKYRVTIPFETCRELLEEYARRCTFFDQDFLNIVTQGHKKVHKSPQYNCSINEKFSSSPNALLAFSTLSILHFIAESKPWRKLVINPMSPLDYAYMMRAVRLRLVSADVLETWVYMNNPANHPLTPRIAAVLEKEDWFA